MHHGLAPNYVTAPLALAAVAPSAVRASSGSPEPLLRTPAAAEVLGLSVPTMQRMRTDGSGPKFIKLKRTCLYRPSDLNAWLETRLASSTADARERGLAA